MPDEIKELQDSIAKSLTAYQAELDTLKKGMVTTERLEGLKEEFGKTTETLQKLNTAIEGEQKARAELELALSRIQAGGGAGAGMQVSSPRYEKAYAAFLRKNEQPGGDIREEEFKQVLNAYHLENLSDDQRGQVKMLFTGSFADGGMFIPVARQSEITKRVFETSPMRELARSITIGTGEASFPLDDEDYFSEKVGELDTRSSNTKTNQFAEIKVPVHRQSSEPWITQEMLEDSVFPVESYIAERVAAKFARTENREFVLGAGNKEAQGFLSLPAWTTQGKYERGKLEYRSTTNTGALDEPNDFIELQSDLLEDFQPNATWVMHRKIWAACMKLRNTDKTYLLNPMMLFSGVVPQLLGRPVRMFGDMDSATTTGKKVVAYGDFRSGYCIVDRIGITIIRDNITQKGVIKYNMTKRTGGGVVNYQAIKVLKIK